MRVAGIGFRSAAETEALKQALKQAMAGIDTIDAIVTEASKARAPAFRALAQELQLPALGITPTDLAHMITPTQSQRIQDKFGTGSLCEAAALAAAGPDAQLIVKRMVSADGLCTVAIAES